MLGRCLRAIIAAWSLLCGSCVPTMMPDTAAPSPLPTPSPSHLRSGVPSRPSTEPPTAVRAVHECEWDHTRSAQCYERHRYGVQYTSLEEAKEKCLAAGRCDGVYGWASDTCATEGCYRTCNIQEKDGCGRPLLEPSQLETTFVLLCDGYTNAPAMRSEAAHGALLAGAIVSFLSAVWATGKACDAEGEDCSTDHLRWMATAALFLLLVVDCAVWSVYFGPTAKGNSLGCAVGPK